MPPIVTLVAFCVWQDSSTGEVGDGDGFGLAVKDVINGGAITLTFTVAAAVTLPAELVAVSTYVVVAAGDTICEPLRFTIPRPGEMLTVAAFCTVQASVDVWPLLMVAGFAVKVMICGTAPGVTVTATLQEVVAPPAPVAVTV